MEKVILEFQDEYRFLSNFYPSIIIVGDLRFGTVEHYYQSAKTNDQDWFLKIAWAKSPGQAKKLGRQAPVREDWIQVRDKFMLQGLRYKFQQNDKLMKKLLDTKNALLVEGNRWGDIYWGFDLREGIGQNRLGQMLMFIRHQYQKEKKK